MRRCMGTNITWGFIDFIDSGFIDIDGVVVVVGCPHLMSFHLLQHMTIIIIRRYKGQEEALYFSFLVKAIYGMNIMTL